MNSMENALPPLVCALLEPQRYPHPAPRIELIETHISWVLLAGDFAYKIKKPVKLPFLDFSTLALRKQYCLDELRLNRRFAPDIYLDVLGLFDSPQGPAFDGSGEPVEYAVKMRRFDEGGRLDRVCARGELHTPQVSDLATTLAAFHQTAASAPAASGFASSDAILRQVLDNFDELLGQPLSNGIAERLAALQRWSRQQHRQLTPLMSKRQQDGHVRECHGDLHLANLVLIDGRVRMFDCIEFNDELRWIDVASDIAFCYVDLLAHQQNGLANWFVDEVLAHSGDYEAALLLRFYAVYRALVRAKVAALRAQQGGAQTAIEFPDYLALAERLTTTPPVRLTITHGVSGCGKTFASEHILQDDTASWTLRLRSDVERKRLFGLASSAHSGAALNSGIYAATAHQQTYRRLHDLAAMLLRAGWSVIVDASFLKRADRDAFRSLARELDIGFAMLAPAANAEDLRRRVLARQALGRDASEATLEVLELQLRHMEPLGADEMRDLRRVSTTAPAAATATAPSSSPESRRRSPPRSP